jgi:hypothetical protein
MTITYISLIVFLVLSCVLALAFYFTKGKVLIGNYIFYFLCLFFILDFTLFLGTILVGNHPIFFDIKPNFNLLNLVIKIILFLSVLIYNLTFFKSTSNLTKITSIIFLAWFILSFSGNLYLFFENFNLRNNFWFQALFYIFESSLTLWTYYVCFYRPYKLKNL